MIHGNKRLQRKRLTVFLLAITLVLSNLLFNFTYEVEASSQKVKLSEGVLHENLTHKVGSNHNKVNILQVNINEPYTQLQIGTPSPLNRLETVRAKATRYDRPGNKVLGAVNASFYQMAHRIPVNLIAENNKLVFGGLVHTNKPDNYVNEPIAFGVDANGKGLIDHYELALNYTYQGKTYRITNTNKNRTTNSTILFTNKFYESDTATNQYGTEVVLETSSNPDLSFGSSYKGTVTEIRKVGDKKPVSIPKNGFVLSGHGNASDRLAKMQIGEEVILNVDIDSKWKNADYMLASGPQLVKNGKADISMNLDSDNAKRVAARTAVAVDKTGKNIFLVTVDHNPDNNIRGMNMQQFANYLVQLGVHTALNLDGGGSTTMVANLPRTSGLQLINVPSDTYPDKSYGKERGVSTILMAVDTEPANWIFKDVSYRSSHYEGISWMKEKGIQGYPDGNYRPSEKMKRSHAAIMFSNVRELEILPASEAPKMFNDIKETTLYADYIATVGNNGIFSGSDGDFLPENTMTRQQMATTIVSAFSLSKSSKNTPINLSNVSNSHKKNVQILADYGITTQLDDFRPSEAVTRGQFATFMYKAMKAIN